jgi:cathepsin B
MDDATWTADPEASGRFGTMEDVKDLCGTWNKNHPIFTSNSVDAPTYVKLPVDVELEALAARTTVPDAFDARTGFSNCTVISKIRDQSACGSCWAFGSTEAFEDRRCVATGVDREFSTEDTAGCCKGFTCGLSNGCGGGQPSAALQWMSETGVVTGDGYFEDNKGTSCKPYTLAPCAHHVPASAKYPACPSKEYSLTCEKKCESAYTTKSYDADKTKGAKSFSVSSVAAMQTAIMTKGPLAVAFTVYSDFPTYKSGVYTHKSGSALGGHAVEMIGWGTMNGTPYWTIKNSWNEQWGDGGTFKIARGTNECGIEDDVSGINF